MRDYGLWWNGPGQSSLRYRSEYQMGCNRSGKAAPTPLKSQIDRRAMTRASMILTAVILTATTTPALAKWEHVGSLDVVSGKTGQFLLQPFKGNVVGLTARDADISCKRVTATFENGSTRPIFKGKLRKGLIVRIDLPPGEVERVNFECRPHAKSHATVGIAADARAQQHSKSIG